MPLVSCKSWEEFPTTNCPRATRLPPDLEGETAWWLVCTLHDHAVCFEVHLSFELAKNLHDSFVLTQLSTSPLSIPIITMLSLLFSIFYRPEALTSAEDSWEWFLPNGCDSAPSVPYPSIFLSQMLGANLIASFLQVKGQFISRKQLHKYTFPNEVQKHHNILIRLNMLHLWTIWVLGTWTSEPSNGLAGGETRQFNCKCDTPFNSFHTCFEASSLSSSYPNIVLTLPGNPSANAQVPKSRISQGHWLILVSVEGDHFYYILHMLTVDDLSLSHLPQQRPSRPMTMELHHLTDYCLSCW